MGREKCPSGGGGGGAEEEEEEEEARSWDAAAAAAAAAAEVEMVEAPYSPPPTPPPLPPPGDTDRLVGWFSPSSVGYHPRLVARSLKGAADVG